MTKRMTQHATAAKQIRAKLKRAFPATKFRVRAKSYSGGSSIDIYWTDGPASKDVESLTRVHEYGSFNGMTDMYEYDADRPETAVTETGELESIAHVKFVFCNREISARNVWTVARHIARGMGESLPLAPPEDWRRVLNMTRLQGQSMTEYVYGALEGIDLTGKRAYGVTISTGRYRAVVA